MSAPRFSIIMVTLNCADDAVRTARSVLAQRGVSYEYIVKDGGSIDGTAERLAAFDISVVSAPDTGVYDAMNQALARTSGRYVCFMNAGDLLPDSQTLETVARGLEQQGEPDFAYGDVRSYVRHPYTGDTPAGRLVSYPERLSRRYLYWKMVCHQAWFVRRDAYARYGGFDTRYRLLADYALLLKMVADPALRQAHIPALTAVYKGGGLSEQQRARADAERQTIQAQAYSRAERLLYGGVLGLARPLARVVRHQLPRLGALRPRVPAEAAAPAARKHSNGE